MEYSFKDANLERLFEDQKFTNGLAEGIIKAFRKRVQQVIAAPDERLFYKLGGIRFEKLQGDRSHQYSMRLNDQWRLILELEGKGPNKTAVIIAIEDYH